MEAIKIAEPLDLHEFTRTVVVRGDANPIHPDWVRDIRDACVAGHVRFIFNGWGEWQPFYERDYVDPDWRFVPETGENVCRLNIAGASGFHGDRLVYFRRVGKQWSSRRLDACLWNETEQGVRV